MMERARLTSLRGLRLLPSAWTLAVLAIGCGGTSSLRANETLRSDDRGDTTTAEASTAEASTAEASTAEASTAEASTAEASTIAGEASTTAAEARTAEVPAEAATTPTTPDALPSSLTMGVSEPVRAQLEILERQSRELERVASLIADIRGPAAVGPDGVPPVCADHAPIEALRIQATSGAAGSHAAASAVEALERWCEPFDRWIHPDEHEAADIRSYLQQIDRVLGWMHEIQRCEHTSGDERARCENAYSDVQREAAAEAARAITLLDEHARELSLVRTGAARFPCTTPVLTRIDAIAWRGSVARAQMGGLARRAMETCHRIGVAEADVRSGERTLIRALDHAESSARAERRNALEAMQAMRGYVE